ncbi:glycosyltransferase [Amedibacillus sp. YH-ame10]
MNKIKLICLTTIEELPPVVTLVKILQDLKVDVTLITMYNETDYISKTFTSKIEYIFLDHRTVPVYSQKRSISRILKFRLNKIWKKLIARSVYNYISVNDCVWVLHEESAHLIGNKIRNYSYFITLYELNMQLQLHKDKLLENICKNAIKVIVPEYCRAHIVRTILGLDELPEILPNKPYEFSKVISTLDNDKHNLLNEIKIKMKPIIVYAGIFIEERKLDSLFEMMYENSEKYELILIGHRSNYLDGLLKEFPSSNIHYLGYISAPNHLAAIAAADIGILTYYANDKSLNSVFCAPNKIYEYTFLKKPVIGNDIPGLKYEIQNNMIGTICDIKNKDSIKNCIDEILKEYDRFSRNTEIFYNSVNIKQIIMEIIGYNEK